MKHLHSKMTAIVARPYIRTTNINWIVDLVRV